MTRFCYLQLGFFSCLIYSVILSRYISFQGISGTVVTNPPKSLCLWDRISLYRAVSGASGPQKVNKISPAVTLRFHSQVCWPSELNQTLALNQLHQNGCRSELASQPVGLFSWSHISLCIRITIASGEVKLTSDDSADSQVTVTAHKDLYAKYCADWALQGRLLWELFNFKCTTSKMWVFGCWLGRPTSWGIEA